MWETFSYDQSYKGFTKDKVINENDWQAKIHVGDPHSGIKAGYVVFIFTTYI